MAIGGSPRIGDRRARRSTDKPGQGDDADDDDDSSRRLGGPTQGFAAHRREGEAEDHEGRRAERRHASAELRTGGIVVFDQQLIDAELQCENILGERSGAWSYREQGECLGQQLQPRRNPISENEKGGSA